MKQVTAMITLLFAAVTVFADNSFLRRGDVWVMSGDSITYNDFYRQTVAAALDHFHPGHGIRIMNTAVWGQLVTEASDQGVGLKPTVATIMLGMNNAIHRDYPAAYDFTTDAAKYAEAIRAQVKDFKKVGADVVLMKPTLTDETEYSYFHVFHTRKGLEAYGAALEKIAVEEGCLVLPIASDLEKFKCLMRENETLVPDGVHPYGWGQYVLAKSLIHHLKVASPLAEKTEKRESVLNEVGFNEISFRRSGPFLADGEKPRIVITAPRSMVAKARWSVEGTNDAGEELLRLEKGVPFAFYPKLKPSSLPTRLGTVGRMILTVTPENGAPSLAVVDFARTKVFHFKDGRASGEIRTEVPRTEGALVGTWEVCVDDSDVWFSGRMCAKEWPKRKPQESDVWMNSTGLNGVMTLFDFRPPDRFAENRFDHDVNMIDLGIVEKPWSVLPLSWINRRTGNCLLAHAEPTGDGYAWRMGFRGRVNDYTRFDISKLDCFGLYFVFADCEGGRISHYPIFGQLFGADSQLRINPELRLNQTAVFDLKGIIPGNETTTMGVFGL